MTLPLLWVEDPTLQQNFDLIAMALGVLMAADFAGTGDPNGVITASPGATYRNRAGGVGVTLWYKSAGVDTNTNWVALP